MIELENVSYSYEGHQALSGISFGVTPGESLCLLGPNGSGKSTLLKLINGLIFSTSGAYRFDGEEITAKRMKDAKFSKRFHQRMLQRGCCKIFLTTPSFFTTRPVSERPLRYRKQAKGSARTYIVRGAPAFFKEEIEMKKLLALTLALCMGAYSIKDKSRIDENVEMVYGHFPRLRERSSQLAGTLSGGEQQMLATGRALMTNPTMMLFDHTVSIRTTMVESDLQAGEILHGGKNERV